MQENQIKEELEKKINKLKEEGDTYRKEAEDLKSKVEEVRQRVRNPTIAIIFQSLYNENVTIACSSS